MLIGEKCTNQLSFLIIPIALLYSVQIQHSEFQHYAHVYVNDRFLSSAVEDKRVIVSLA